MIDYNKLVAEAQASQKKRSRIILTPGYDMVICLLKDSYVRMHRHPRYEAYHVLEGQLQVTGKIVFGGAVDTPEDLEKVRAKWVPSVFTPSRGMVCIPPMAWHEPKAVGNYVIYREFYCGPFEKARDVEYHPEALPEAA